MRKLVLGSIMALLFMNGPAVAECLYQGALYSEGARVCMHRTMFLCRGARWVKTAERCWERSFTQARRLPYREDELRWQMMACERSGKSHWHPDLLVQ
jgi:hypothetical protein